MRSGRGAPSAGRPHRREHDRAQADEDAPLTILLMAEICQQFLPPGVLNVVTGTDGPQARPWSTIPAVDKVSFTGSTEVGRGIAGRAGSGSPTSPWSWAAGTRRSSSPVR